MYFSYCRINQRVSELEKMHEEVRFSVFFFVFFFVVFFLLCFFLFFLGVFFGGGDLKRPISSVLNYKIKLNCSKEDQLFLTVQRVILLFSPVKLPYLFRHKTRPSLSKTTPKC